MTKKNKIITATLSVLLVICMVATCFVLLNNKKVQAGTLSNVEYQTEYEYGTTLDIQKATLTVDGKDYEADFRLKFPNGRTVSAESVLLNQSGEFSLVYFKNLNGKIFNETIMFTVRAPIFTFLGDGEYTYGTNNYLGEDVKGLNVKLMPGSTLQYNKVIDISENTKLDEIIKLYCTPTQKGVKEIEKFNLTLTDVHDVDNFVTVEYKWSPDRSYYTIINANANGQSRMAARSVANLGTEKGVEIDGVFYNGVRKDDPYFGYTARTSTDGSDLSEGVVEPYGNNCHQLMMDYAERRVYVQRPIDITGNNLVIDLDEEFFCGENVWEGFTTGEVNLSLTATPSGGGSNGFNFFVTELQGQDISKNVKDEVAPLIDIDFGRWLTENGVPKAVKNKKYKIFDAQFSDDSGELADSGIYVYLNYNNTSRVSINIEDGAFVPVKAGIYTILYTATDRFGNKTEKTVDVIAYDSLNPTCSFGTYQSTVAAGSKVDIANYTVNTEMSVYDVDIYAVCNQSKNEYQINKRHMTFVPVEVGSHTIEYRYKDYVQETVFSYQINVEKVDAPIFAIEPNLPRHLIKGCNFNIEDYYGYDFSNGSEKIKANIFVKEDGGNEIALTSNTYNVKASSSVEFIYKLTNNNDTSQKSVVVPVVDTGYGNVGQLDLSKYLYGEAFVADAKSDKIVYQASQTGDLKLLLITPAFIDMLNVCFGVVPGQNAFNKMSLVLTDVVDSDNQVRISFEKQSDSTSKVSITKYGYEISDLTNSTFDGSKDFGVSVKDGKLVVAESRLSIGVDNIFNGFSKFVYVDIELDGVSGQSAIEITQLMNQQMNNAKYDSVAPTVSYTPFNYQYYLGDKINISSFIVYDFVDPMATFSYSITKDSAFAVADDGTTLGGNQDYGKEYVISCSSYFTLSLNGRARDYSGNSSKKVLQATEVKDVLAPTVMIENAVIEGKIEEKISFGTCVVSDDKDGSDVSVNIAVVSPKGVYTYYPEGDGFIPTIAGKYRVVYYVFDKAGNTVFYEYTVTIK